VYDVLIGEKSVAEVTRATSCPSSASAVGPRSGGAEIDSLLEFAADELPRPLRLVAPTTTSSSSTPTSLGLLTLNASARGRRTGPAQCAYYALEGLSDLQATVQSGGSVAQPRPRHRGILLCMSNAPDDWTEQVTEEVLLNHCRRPGMYDTPFRATVRLSEASFGQTDSAYDVASKAPKSYMERARVSRSPRATRAENT